MVFGQNRDFLGTYLIKRLETRHYEVLLHLCSMFQGAMIKACVPFHQLLHNSSFCRQQRHLLYSSCSGIVLLQRELNTRSEYEIRLGHFFPPSGCSSEEETKQMNGVLMLRHLSLSKVQIVTPSTVLKFKHAVLYFFRMHHVHL